MKEPRKVLGLILLCSLLLAAACSTGAAAKSRATLTPDEKLQQDPTFWPMWGSGSKRPGADFKIYPPSQAPF